MTKNEKRLLTVTGTFLAIVAVGVLTIVPYVRKWQFYDKSIAERQTKIHNLKRQIANKPVLVSEIASVNEIMSSSDLFILAANKADASGQLLASVKKLVENAGGQINSINILDKEHNKLAKNVTTIKIRFVVRNEGLIEILQALIVSKPLLNVTTAQITPILKRGRKVNTDTGKVRLDLLIEAFYVTRELQ